MEHIPMQTGHPTPASVREVAARFHRAAKRARILDMEEPNVRVASTNNACSTVACAAGHYMLQHAIDKLETEATGRGGAARQDPGTEGMDWEQGTLLITNDLGSENDEHLMGWADANPQLWGNDDGWELFYQEDAYDFSGPRLTLTDIAKHWERVADRIETFERLEQIG